MVIRVPRKIKYFEYEGVKFAMRSPNTYEMNELTKLTAAYQRSANEEIKTNVESKIQEYAVVTGKLELMRQAQLYIVKTTTIDPETKHLVFNDSDNKVEDQDSDFIATAWACYMGEEVKRYPYSKLKGLFDSEFLNNVLTVEASVIHTKIQEIRKENLEEANKIAYLLEYKTKEETASIPLETVATTTSTSEETS